MALDATVGGASANSYDTLAKADAYFADRLHTTVWDAASDPDKSAGLVTASLLIDSLCFNGKRVTATQNLEFPRSGLKLGGLAVPTDVIPRPIEVATYEFAQVLLGEDLTTVKDQLKEGLKRLKAGDITLEFFEGFQHTSVPPSIVDRIPSDWICGDDKPTVSFKVF